MILLSPSGFGAGQVSVLLDQTKNSGNKKHVRDGHGCQKMYKHEASDGTFPNMFAIFEGYCVPVRVDHFP